MKILRGKLVTQELEHIFKKEIAELNTVHNIHTSLAVIQFGNNPASSIYVRRKQEMCEKLGINSLEYTLPQETSQNELIELINSLNNDNKIHGILCQLPLPQKIDEAKILLSIDPSKDIDCFHPINVGLLVCGTPRFMPCTPYGALQILKRYNYATAGKRIVIIGRSNIVGKPLANLLSLKEWGATVTLCHSQTKFLPDVCKEADILVAALGKPQFVTHDFIKKGAVVIDVGINRIEDATTEKKYKIVGDVDFDDVVDRVEAITPVPGGVGPLTIAMLMYNTINAARSINSLPLINI